MIALIIISIASVAGVCLLIDWEHKKEEAQYFGKSDLNKMVKRGDFDSKKLEDAREEEFTKEDMLFW